MGGPASQRGARATSMLARRPKPDSPYATFLCSYALAGARSFAFPLEAVRSAAGGVVPPGSPLSARGAAAAAAAAAANGKWNGIGFHGVLLKYKNAHFQSAGLATANREA